MGREEARRGAVVRPAFVYLLGLLIAITVLVAVVSLIGALTDFGA